MGDKKIAELLKEKKIHQVINARIVEAEPDITVKQAIDLMQLQRSGYVVLVKNRKLAGIFTETDVTQKVLGKDIDWNKPVSEFATKKPTTMSKYDTVGDAMDLMATKGFYHLPLIDEASNLTGMLSVRTLIRFLAEYYPNETFNLPPSPQVPVAQEGG